RRSSRATRRRKSCRSASTRSEAARLFFTRQFKLLERAADVRGVHLRFGFPFQPAGQFRERGVGLHRHVLLQQGEQLLVQRRRITAAVRQRRKTLTTTPE